MQRHRVRHSVFFVTLNTHKRVDPPLTNTIKNHLESIVFTLNDTDNCRSALSHTFSPTHTDSKIKQSRVQTIGVEIGPVTRLLHVHWTWYVEHTGHIDITHLNTTLQTYFERITHIPGLYVHCDILKEPSRRLNYYEKQRHQAAAPLQPRTFHFQRRR
jgi:hypothetical protein